MEGLPEGGRPDHRSVAVSMEGLPEGCRADHRSVAASMEGLPEGGRPDHRVREASMEGPPEGGRPDHRSLAVSMEGLPEGDRPDHRVRGGVHGGAPRRETDRTTKLGRGGPPAGYTRVGSTAARESLAVCQLRVNPAEGWLALRAKQPTMGAVHYWYCPAG